MHDYLKPWTLNALSQYWVETHIELASIWWKITDWCDGAKCIAASRITCFSNCILTCWRHSWTRSRFWIAIEVPFWIVLPLRNRVCSWVHTAPTMEEETFQLLTSIRWGDHREDVRLPLRKVLRMLRTIQEVGRKLDFGVDSSHIFVVSMSMSKSRRTTQLPTGRLQSEGYDSSQFVHQQSGRSNHKYQPEGSCLSVPTTDCRKVLSKWPSWKSRCSSPTLLCSQWVAAPKEVRERVMFLTINQQVTPVISLALSAPFRWVEYQDSQTPQDGSLLVLLVVEAALGCQGRRHTKGALCNSELFSNVYCKEGLSPAHATYLWRLHRLVFSPCSWRTLRTIWTYAWSFLWCW